MRYVRLFGSLVRLLRQNSYMIRSMVARDMKKRYVGSLLGIYWSVIHPLIQLLLYYFVFSVVLKMRLGPEYGGTPVAVWLIAGLLPWMMFAEVLSRSPDAVIEHASVIKKMAFPSELLPIVKLTAAALNHLIGVVILIALLAVSGYEMSPSVFLFIPYLFAMGFFALGVSWLLSALNVFLRDIGQLVAVFVNIWFFLTPIVYARELIPQRFQWLYALNPIVHVIEGYRAALLGKTEIPVWGLVYLLAAGVAVFGLGGLAFKKLKPAFAEVL